MNPNNHTHIVDSSSSSGRERSLRKIRVAPTEGSRTSILPRRSRPSRRSHGKHARPGFRLYRSAQGAFTRVVPGPNGLKSFAIGSELLDFIDEVAARIVKGWSDASMIAELAAGIARIAVAKRARECLDEKGIPASWLYRVVHDGAVSALRKVTTERKYIANREHPAPVTDPAELVASEDDNSNETRRTHILDEINRLPDATRTAIAGLIAKARIDAPIRPPSKPLTASGQRKARHEARKRLAAALGRPELAPRRTKHVKTRATRVENRNT